jgi:protein-S-isoprenylcysteine O-methyltransferase Ste14
MSAFIKRFKAGRFIWTVLVTFYFVVFFTNFLKDVLPGATILPVLFSYLFVAWLSLEYYFGSPFFQSGVVEHSALWRGVFAFFAYPLLGYVAADFIWWHWTQLPVPTIISGLLGLAVFGLGTYARLDTLRGLLRIGQVRPPAKGAKEETVYIPEKKLVALRPHRMSRHPRYFATLVQLVGAAIFFRSWGGLVLVLAVGLPLILLQVRYEDARLREVLKGEFEPYGDSVPAFWPRFR